MIRKGNIKAIADDIGHAMITKKRLFKGVVLYHGFVKITKVFKTRRLFGCLCNN